MTTGLRRFRGPLARRAVAVWQGLEPVAGIFLWSRALIWAGALFALLVFEPNRHPRADRWDDPALTRDLGWISDVWARWDGVWFLRIAHDGYGSVKGAAAAFYPLYPLTLGGLGRMLGGHYVLAGILISLAACLAAFALLYRLSLPLLGEAGARRAVLYLAIAPMSLFLQAVYSEALYLALAIAAFLLAERGRWPAAGAATGLAILTRVAGVALLPALVVIAWRSRDRRRALLGLCLAPLIWAVYPLYLWASRGDPFAFAGAQEFWNRHISAAGPLGGLWDGLRSGWAGIEQLVSGSHTHRYWPVVQDTDPMRVAAVNLEALAFLAVLLWLGVLAWRRLGAPYGLYVLVSLAIPLSVPSSRWPLLSIPRFGLVLFPVFMALATVGRSPRANTAVILASSVMLGIAVSQWALWQWVA